MVSVADEHRGVEVEGVLYDPMPFYERDRESPGCVTELFRYILGADLTPKPGEGA